MCLLSINLLSRGKSLPKSKCLLPLLQKTPKTDNGEEHTAGVTTLVASSTHLIDTPHEIHNMVNLF